MAGSFEVSDRRELGREGGDGDGERVGRGERVLDVEVELVLGPAAEEEGALGLGVGVVGDRGRGGVDELEVADGREARAAEEVEAEAWAGNG